MLISLNDQLSILELSGVDTAKFLQGQLTNDINHLADQPYQFSAHLNNKGRMLASFIICRPHNDTYYLITSSTVVDKIIPRLKMFILRSKVNVTVSEIGIFFSDRQFPECINLKLKNNHYLNLGVISGTAAVDTTLWHKFLVDHGLPMIYAASYEKILPQQVNYDLIGAINFKKGCYTGQEIVARTHYLGKIKRRMYRFTTQVAPTIGQTVLSPILDNQEAGCIIDYYANGDGCFVGLVSAQSDCIEQLFLDLNNLNHLKCSSIDY